jgi:hypothetical protein
MGMEILTLSPQEPILFHKFNDKVSQIVELRFQFNFVRELNEVPKFFYSNNDPAVVFFDMTSRGFNSKKIEDMQSLFAGMRKLDPGVCIILLVDFNPTSDQLMDWMDRGASGILDWNFDPKQISEALWDLLSDRFRLKRHVPRAPVRHKIQIKYSTLEQALVAETLNVGFGGFFVNTIISGALLGDFVDFEFQKTATLSDNNQVEVSNKLVNKMNEDAGDASSIIAGVGKIAWIRNRESPDNPRGMGVQFVELAEQHRKWIENFVRSHRIHAFIPKK